MAYTPDPNNPSQPADNLAIGYVASDVRALKQKVIDNKSATDTAIAANATAISDEATARADADAAEVTRATTAESALSDAITELESDTATAITAAVTAIKETIFHVGAYFITHSDVAPDILLDMPGTTWARIAMGNSLVSRSPGDLDYGVSGGTVGSSTVVIGNNNLPNHAHGVVVTDPGHTHEYTRRGTSISSVDLGSSSYKGVTDATAFQSSSGPANTGIGVTVQPTTNNNDPLDIRNAATVANIWRRTA